ncbi:MAG: GH92 family glycosyl hydrolase, partial [Bacteroidota bacterium]
PTDFSKYVDPFIGTGGHGHTYPGVSLPFGMVQLSPDTRLDGWDGCSGYHASDTAIYGFTHTHLSGTGCSDYGDILFMPLPGKVNLQNTAYKSTFSHLNESASPGYYKVILNNGKITAELTATKRTGFHRYTFSGNREKFIALDLVHRDKVLESNIRIVNDSEIEGSRISQAWAAKQILYFVARFSSPISSHLLVNDENEDSKAVAVNGTAIRALFGFDSHGSTIELKVGISAVSIENARKNLDVENPGWDFEQVAKLAREEWNRELGKITGESTDPTKLTIFYTSLYHALLNPNLYSDVDGRYRGRDLEIHSSDKFDYYTVFSLWDTYRATHPLFTLIDQKRTNDFINTFIRQYEEGGMLPVWELSGNETGCMIGYHSVPVIVDAYLKGIRGFDAEKAFTAMKHSAEQDHLGLKYYKPLGFIPGDKEGESVSKTLEYAYDDWCIAQMAKSLGKTEDYKVFIQRAQNYKNIFDPSTGFMRAKMNNIWFSPFDPSEVNFNYTEANAWQYSFYVPQDLGGLMQLHGGRNIFAKNLDRMFQASTKTTGRDQSDISGLIGQYAHGNEPSHHMAYLYNYAGQPWKTEELVHSICKDLYTSKRDGLCGNEDCGQMSSWYVFSAMGFYPVTPGSGNYSIGTPLFNKVTINLENGNKFILIANLLSDQNFYIQSAKLNGKELKSPEITHEEIMKGGELLFEMGANPNISWGSDLKDIHIPTISEHQISP